MLLSKPRHIEVGRYHLIIEDGRVWVYGMSIRAERTRRATLNERKKLKHVTIGEDAARRLAWEARFLSYEEKDRLGTRHEHAHTPEYPEWRRRAAETHTFLAHEDLFEFPFSAWRR